MRWLRVLGFLTLLYLPTHTVYDTIYGDLSFHVVLYWLGPENRPYSAIYGQAGKVVYFI